MTIIDFLAAHAGSGHDIFHVEVYRGNEGRRLVGARNDGVRTTLELNLDASWDETEDVISQRVWCEPCEEDYTIDEEITYDFN